MGWWVALLLYVFGAAHARWFLSHRRNDVEWRDEERFIFVYLWFVGGAVALYACFTASKGIE